MQTTSFEKRFEVKKFWANAYAAGCRITFDGKRFQFHEAAEPSVRVERMGKTYGKLPDLKPVQPSTDVLEGIEEYNGHLISFLSQKWPAGIDKYAYHIFCDAYEMIPIALECATMGHFVGSEGAICGRMPIYNGPLPSEILLPTRRKAPQILAEYSNIEIERPEIIPPFAAPDTPHRGHATAIVGYKEPINVRHNGVQSSLPPEWLDKRSSGAAYVNPSTGAAMKLERLGIQKLLRIATNYDTDHDIVVGPDTVLCKWDGGTIRAGDAKPRTLLHGRYGCYSIQTKSPVEQIAYRITNIDMIGGIYVATP